MVVFELTMIAAWFGFTAIWSCVWIFSGNASPARYLLSSIRYTARKKYHVEDLSRVWKELTRLDNASSDLALKIYDKY